jgi:NTE family protein
MSVKTDYYIRENKRFLKKHPSSSPYVYNRETLGFRLSSRKEIAVFRYGAEPQHEKIDDLFDYSKALVTTILGSQENIHLHSNDWQRTIYIDTLGVATTDFGLSNTVKQNLEDSGEKGTRAYFYWFDDVKSEPFNRP